MKIDYSPHFYRQYKKANVRISNIIDEKMRLFAKNPYDAQLNNHPLKREYKGYRSIDITADWRALYEELNESTETIAYFIEVGTHKKLYRQKTTKP